MCRAYVDLIDLTGELPSDREEEISDIDDLPLPEVSLSTTYGRYEVYMHVYEVNPIPVQSFTYIFVYVYVHQANVCT